MLAVSAMHAMAQPKPAGPTSAAPTVATAKATFAGGCFWCVESDFDKIPGVLSTTSGYIGGKTANPTYEQVSSHTTGHAEAVEVVFDPAKVSYERLVEYFWHTIDPTVKDQQFCDRGTPYRTAIFAHDDEQLKIAQASRAALEKTKPFKEPIVTEIVLARHVLPGRGLPPGLLPEEPDSLQVLPHQLRPRRALATVVGRSGGALNPPKRRRHALVSKRTMHCG